MNMEIFAIVYFSRMEFKSRKSRKIVAREKYPVYSNELCEDQYYHVYN